jgi:hypothetical protein
MLNEVKHLFLLDEILCVAQDDKLEAQDDNVENQN